jgi:serine/threonine protein kinase
VLYHLLTGQTPFQDANILGQIVKHATEAARPIFEFIPNFPDGLQQVINWMMAKDPNQRYPTPMQAAQALQAFLTQTPVGAAKNNPLPDYVKYLKESDPDIPSPATAASPGAIPVGKIETTSRRRERKNDGTGPKPKLPVQAAPLDDGQYDVEIVAVAPATGLSPGQPFSLPSTPQPSGGSHKRSLFELDRRDFIMAGIGGGLVLSAILIGYGLSQLLRRPAPSPTSEEEKQVDPVPQRRLPVEKKDPEKKQDEAQEDKKTGDVKQEKKTEAKDDKMVEEKKTNAKDEKDPKKDEKKTDAKPSEKVKE